MHRRRRGGRGRFPIQPKVVEKPFAERFIPEPLRDNTPVYINLAEAEVLRLVDLEGLYQEQAGIKMGISRGTIWRLLSSARQKVVQSMFEGRPLIIGHPDAEEQ
jgi:predicted DNA-binding protein (UPF0251 family)